MAEPASEQEQRKKTLPTSEPARLQPGIQAPQPEAETPGTVFSHGPGLGSPAGYAKRAGDGRLRLNANRQQRAQTMTAMQRRFGNQHVQRFMVQRRAAGAFAPVQREDKKGDKDADAGNITVDEQGVTNAVYNKPSFTTKDEKATPAATPKDVKPEDDFVDVAATAVCTYKATVTISLPAMPGGLTACQTKRVKDAIDNKLAPHEKQHEAAMKTYDGAYEEAFTLTHILRSTVTAQLTAKAKLIADAQQATREAAAKQASDALDQPPFVVIVDLNCEDEKPGKKQSTDAGADPEQAGGEVSQPAAAGEQAPSEAA